jgi:ABC-type lipoprotein release transport system permease subunit
MQEINILFLSASIAIGLIGVYLGWLARGGVLSLSEERVQIFISLVITFIWAASVVASIITPTHTVSPAVHVIMGLVAAYFFKKDILNIQVGQQ